jgi:hypothetical protein
MIYVYLDRYDITYMHYTTYFVVLHVVLLLLLQQGDVKNPLTLILHNPIQNNHVHFIFSVNINRCLQIKRGYVCMFACGVDVRL